jgi:hypothetical protein
MSTGLYLEDYKKADTAVVATSVTSGGASMTALIVATATMCTTTVIASAARMAAPVAIIVPYFGWKLEIKSDLSERAVKTTVEEYGIE